MLVTLRRPFDSVPVKPPGGKIQKRHTRTPRTLQQRRAVLYRTLKPLPGCMTELAFAGSSPNRVACDAAPAMRPDIQ
jgi:hypothetical protein